MTLGAARAAGVLQETLVVHRPDDEAVRSLAIDYDAYPVATRSAHAEFSDSLRTGIELLRTREPGHASTAVLVCLGDQPLLRLDVIRALVATWRMGAGGIAAVRPSYRDTPGEPGHPLLLDWSVWRLASEMRGDQGLAPVLQRHGVAIRSVSVAGMNPDIDTLADFEALEHQASGASL